MLQEDIMSGVEDWVGDEERESKLSFFEDINDIYPEANIKVERDQYSIFELNRKFQKKQLVLDPDFQREAVWKKEQQSELIESVLMGIPLPIFYLNETKDGKLVVVDGKQRLTTFIAYLNNEFRLSRLKILKELNGLKFEKLDERLQSSLEDFQIIAQVIKPPTPDRIKFDIFDRVNRGGTSLNNQEMRNALYQGTATELLKKLSQLEIFQRATGYSIQSKRMKDRYFILRFLAFYLWQRQQLIDENGKLIDYRNDLDEFLGKTMDYLNRQNNRVIQELTDVFEQTMENNLLIFQEDAFRRIAAGGKKKPVNMILFEAFGYFFTHFNNEFCKLHQGYLKERCEELLEKPELNRLMTHDRGRGVVVSEVFKMFEQLKEEIVSDIAINNSSFEVL